MTVCIYILEVSNYKYVHVEQKELIQILNFWRMSFFLIKIKTLIFLLGTLTLVDLAGSERLEDSANTSTNNETKKINLSLLELTLSLRKKYK